MTEYFIRYEIQGEAKIEAESPEHAQEMFEAMDVEELALSGSLISYAPETQTQIDQAIAEVRDGATGISDVMRGQ